MSLPPMLKILRPILVDMMIIFAVENLTAKSRHVMALLAS
jgi:hypothetical protein